MYNDQGKVGHERLTMNPEPKLPTDHSHAVLKTPLKGVGNKWSVATVKSGDHAGKDVCIICQFSDGWCVCDMGEDDPIEVIRIEDMKLWVSVKSVETLYGTHWHGEKRT